MKGFEWLHFARTRIIIWFLVGFIIGFGIMLTVMHAQGSLIAIDSPAVHVGDVFPVRIMCFPSQPIKGWEFMLHHSPLLSIMNITNGDFFGEYFQFPVVKNMTCYNLIVGQGNVSTAGSLVTIFFQAEGNGSALVWLTGAGVVNETGYLPLTVLNGTVAILLQPSWMLVSIGWTSFPEKQYGSYEGWNRFQNGRGLFMEKGWNRFKNDDDERDPWMMLLGALVGLALVLIGVVVFLKI